MQSTVFILFNVVVGIIINLFSIYIYEITLYKELFAIIALVVSYAHLLLRRPVASSILVQIISFICFVIIYIIMRFGLIGL
jgi:hypothetical protein